MPVGVVVNGRPLPEPALIVARGGQLYVRADDMRGWGMDLREPPAPLMLDDDAYIPLAAIKGLVASLDTDTGTLQLKAGAGVFPHLAIDTTRETTASVSRSQIVPAQFVDYDITYSRWNGVGRLSGFVDAGVSGGWGVLDSGTLVDTSGAGAVRLDTTYRRDFPERRLRLSIGDNVGDSTAWSRAVRYGGIYLGTDFSLEPQGVFFPLPVVSGSALEPSTIELLSDTARKSFQVQPGTFDVTMQPRLSGTGQVTMTVRDLAGNARQVTRSFYTSTELLRPGLSAFSLEAGFLRDNYGLASFDYGAPFAAFSLRRGISRTLTVEGRVEASSQTRMAGAGGTVVLGTLGQLSAAGAVSQGVAGTGALVRIQAQRITPLYALTFSYQQAGAAFRQVGDARHGSGATSELSASGSIDLGRIGSLNASYARLRQGMGTPLATSFDLASLSLSSTVRSAYLSLGLQYTAQRSYGAGGSGNGGQGRLGVFGSLTVTFGPRAHASLVTEDHRAAASYERGLPDTSGFGYRALAGTDHGSAWYEGSLALRSSAGDVRVDVIDRGGQAGQSGFQANARGALLRVGTTLLATPRIDYGFALVDVDAKDPVTVSVENRPVPRRASEGHDVIVTGLQPYAPNRVAVDPADMPIEASLPEAEQRVVTGWRQATRVTFGTSGTSGALLRLVDNDGQPLDAGETAEWTGGSGVVGMDGEVWIEDYRGAGRLIVTTPMGKCFATIPPLAPAQRLTPHGSVACTPVTQIVDAK